MKSLPLEESWLKDRDKLKILIPYIMKVWTIQLYVSQ